jgi:peptide/nickel transport system substrate-binding protein
MQDAGLILQTGGPTGWPAFYYHLMPNTADPASPMANLKVREAVEYALDKPAICDAIGYGRYTPLYEVAGEGEWGAGVSGIKREYDPVKAKQLLTEAGFADGCPITLEALVESGGRSTAAEACKQYLDAAGFVTTLDIADAGRYFGEVFGTGWKDLVIMFSGTDVNYLVSATRWWAPDAMTQLASFKRPEGMQALFDAAVSTRGGEAEQEKLTGPIIAMMTEQCLMIPFYASPQAIAIPDYVHTDYPAAGFVAWDWRNTWMDPH